MPGLTLGGAEIAMVEEVSGHRYTPDFMFPEVTAEEVARNSGWMAPDLYDPARNLLAMVRQTNVIRTGGQVILIDTCVGDCKPRSPPAFNMLETAWLDNFRRTGLRFEDVDIVMCTHLHVDHVGWNTRLENGRWVPTFPNARYIFGQTEFDHWAAEHAAGRDSPHGPIFADSILPVVETGQQRIVDDAQELANGFRLEPTPGHSIGHVAIHLENEAGHVVFSGDVMHHPIQVREPHLFSRFCEDPEAAVQTRRRFLDTCADRDVIVAPAHFQRGTFGRVSSAADGFHFDFLNGPSSRG